MKNILNNKGGFAIIEGLIAAAVIGVLTVGTIGVAGNLKKDAESVSQAMVDRTRQQYTMILSLDGDVHDPMNMSDVEIRDVYGSDLTDKEVKVIREILDGTLDIDEYNASVQAEGWELTPERCDQMRDILGDDTVSDEEINRLFGTRPEDFTDDGTEELKNLDTSGIDWEFVREILGDDGYTEKLEEIISILGDELTGDITADAGAISPASKEEIKEVLGTGFEGADIDELLNGLLSEIDNEEFLEQLNR